LAKVKLNLHLARASRWPRTTLSMRYSRWTLRSLISLCFSSTSSANDLSACCPRCYRLKSCSWVMPLSLSISALTLLFHFMKARPNTLDSSLPQYLSFLRIAPNYLRTSSHFLHLSIQYGLSHSSFSLRLPSPKRPSLILDLLTRYSYFSSSFYIASSSWTSFMIILSLIINLRFLISPLMPSTCSASSPSSLLNRTTSLKSASFFQIKNASL